MDQENIDIYLKFKELNHSVFKGMSIQELFDLRHDLLELRNTLGEMMNE